MKLKNSLDSLSSLKKLSYSLATLSLFFALSASPKKSQAQEKPKAQTENIKDKYYLQLVSETQREMKLEEERLDLEKFKVSLKKLFDELVLDRFFIKDKKEESFDSYLSGLEQEIPNIKNKTQLLAFVDKTMNLLTSLNQKSVTLNNERITTWPKEVHADAIETHLAMLTSFKNSLNIDKWSATLDVLSNPSVLAMLSKAKSEIQKKEEEYNKQIELNDSLKQDYRDLAQNVYDLEKNNADMENQIQTKNTEISSNADRLNVLNSLDTNIDQEDFQEKLNLQNQINDSNKKIEELEELMEKNKEELVVKTNQLPIREVNIDQNIRKLGILQKQLLDLKDKRYKEISEKFKSESVFVITGQEKIIDLQMAALQKSIERYNFGIDSLTTELSKMNEEIMKSDLEDSGKRVSESGKNVIQQRESNIQLLLKEHVKYSQELEKLYSIYQSVLLQNKNAISRLEDDNPFIITDIESIEQEKSDLEYLIESLQVAINAKDKEKSETKDDNRVIALINELTVLFADLQRAETSLKQTETLLAQRKDFDNKYLQKKDQELWEIQKVESYIENNLSASKHAIWTFVYGYYMQLKKAELENLEIKVSWLEKAVNSKTANIKNKTEERENIARQIDENRKSSKKATEILALEKQLFVKRNSLAADIEWLKRSLQKEESLLEENKQALVELQALQKEFAVLANEELEAYLEFSFNGLQLKDWLKDNKYPTPTKLPMDISDFSTIEKLIKLIKENWLDVTYSIENIKKLYK